MYLLQVTTIGRYGMSTARCRIPIGLFYGHMVLIPNEGSEETSAKCDDKIIQVSKLEFKKIYI